MHKVKVIIVVVQVGVMKKISNFRSIIRMHTNFTNLKLSSSFKSFPNLLENSMGFDCPCFPTFVKTLMFSSSCKITLLYLFPILNPCHPTPHNFFVKLWWFLCKFWNKVTSTFLWVLRFNENQKNWDQTSFLHQTAIFIWTCPTQV